MFSVVGCASVVFASCALFGSTASLAVMSAPVLSPTGGAQNEVNVLGRIRTLWGQDDEEAVDVKDKSPVQKEIAELREKVAALKKEIQEKAALVKVRKVFAKRIEKLKTSYGLKPAQVKKLELAAKGAISRVSRRSIEEYRWTEDLPEWAESLSWAEGYLFRDGEHQYMGEKPSVFFASKQSIWIKAVQSVLTEQQRAERKKDREERRQFRYDSIARMNVVELDSRLKLTAAQRKQMVAVYVAFIDGLKVNVNFEWLPLLLESRIDEQPADEVEKILTPPQFERWQNEIDDGDDCGVI